MLMVHSSRKLLFIALTLYSACIWWSLTRSLTFSNSPTKSLSGLRMQFMVYMFISSAVYFWQKMVKVQLSLFHLSRAPILLVSLAVWFLVFQGDQCDVLGTSKALKVFSVCRVFPQACNQPPKRFCSCHSLQQSRETYVHGWWNHSYQQKTWCWVAHDLGPWVNAYTIFKIRCWKGLSTNLSVIFVMIPFCYRGFFLIVFEVVAMFARHYQEDTWFPIHFAYPGTWMW